MSVLSKVLRAGEGKKLRRLAEIVPLIDALEPEMEALSDDALSHKTVDFRERLDNGEDLDDLLVEAFAVVREAARRVIGQRHFGVQLMGGMALHFGWIAEMKTGEGKTLVSTLPVYLNALTGAGVHMVTVNDYLAARDAEWMGQIHRFLGLSVGLLLASKDALTPEGRALRREAYDCDVTYGTNTEFGFDYLRDNMVPSLDNVVQRGHAYAIIDEVDSILIDEARTPLIISGPAAEAARLYPTFAAIARNLRREVDYEVDEEKRTVVPTEEGIEKVERLLGVTNMYDMPSANYVHLLGKALEAKELYRRDKDYVVVGGEVKIVDEFRGRILEGRRWSDGLHQAVEAKERVAIKEEDHTWATVTLQNYFRMYDKLAGMTGTAETEASEFANTYNMPVVPIPTNKPMIRVDRPDLIYKSEAGKFGAIVEDVAERFATGQPVLVGTASVAKSEILSGLLERRGIPHRVLNAKTTSAGSASEQAREGTIIAQAGRLHAVTVATNMAGRGVDIILGGNPEGLALADAEAEGVDLETEEGRVRLAELRAKYEEQCRIEGERVRELGGLYVLGSERHESRRIDNQLRGRSGRQGDPGESRFFLSLEDDLMRIFATGAINWVMGKALPEDLPIEARMVTKAIERAQNTVEARNAEIRKDVLKYDEVMDQQRKVIYARRLQILEGEDLRARTIELLESALDTVVRAACPNEYPENWDLDGLLAEVAQYYPTGFTAADLAEAVGVDHIYESLRAEAIAYYEARESALPGGAEMAREVERQVMLQIIDQRWREHLVEMDHLREGINLRAIASMDPLVAWQKDGYEYFAQLMASIDDDYLRYVMHVEVVPEAAPEPDLAGATYTGGDEVGESLAAGRAAAALSPSAQSTLGAPAAAPASIPSALPEPGARDEPGAGNGTRPEPAAQERPLVPVVRSERDRTGRNEPCWCGSGRKYKLCHGR